MDQHGIQENGAVERGREVVDPRTVAYRQLAEGALRLHSLGDPERVVSAALDFAKQLLGCPGILLVQSENQEQRYPFGGPQSDALPVSQVILSAHKAMEAGAPVIDGQGTSRGVAVGLGVGARSVGALYVLVSDLERRLGSAYLDVLSVLGKHLGMALDNAFHLRDLRLTSGRSEEESEAGGLSLADAKRAYEKKLVRARLRDARGNIAAAARSLEMDRGQLSRLLKKHGIDKSSYRGGSVAAS